MADARQKSRQGSVWLRKELLSKNLNKYIKKRIIKAIIWSVALYAAETWTYRKKPATEAEITTLIHASQNKQCDLDPIPPSLLKECADLLVPTITNIINLSLSTGTFPMQFKDSVV